MKNEEENATDYPRLEDMSVVNETSQTTTQSDVVTTIVQTQPPWPPMVSGILGAFGTKIMTGTANSILKGIKTGQWRERVEAVRNLPNDSKEQKRAKENLLAVHWSGTFTGRGKIGLKDYSGIVCVDLDHLDNPSEVIAKLSSSPHVICAYVSPRGKGVKVLVDARGHDGETHNLAYGKACSLVKELTGQEPDNTPDVCRLCFVSFDPNLVVNWDTKPLPTPISEEIEASRAIERKRPQDDIEFKVTDRTTPYGKKALEAECQRIQEAPDGQRNNTIFKASAAIGELVAGGEIAEVDAVSALENAASAIGDDYQKDIQTVANGLTAGCSSPRKAPAKEEDAEDQDEYWQEVVAEAEAEGRLVTSPDGVVIKPKAKEPVKLDRSAWGIVSGADLNKTKPEPHQWVIVSWLPVGLTKLIAPEKSGKTFLAFQMAICVADGKPFLGVFEISKPGRVLYLGLEQSLGLNHERLISMSRGGSIPDNLDIVSAGSDWPPLDRGGLERLEAYIKEEKPALVVIDVWQALAPSANGRDNAYQADSKALRPLHGLANSTGTAILIIHHTRKGSALSKDPSESTSGSRAMDSVPDHNIFLNREHGSNDGLVKTKTRVAKPIDDMALRFNPDSCLWTYIGSGDEHSLNVQRVQLLEILAEAKELSDALSPMDVATMLAERGIVRSCPAVRIQLNRMFDAGQVQRTGAGKRGESHRYYGAVPADQHSVPDEIHWDSDKEDSFLF